MLITKIQYQKKDPNRVNMYIDGDFFCGIALDTIASENLYEGLNIDDATLDRIVEKDLSTRFLTRSIEYLSRSPRTEFQMLRYLNNLKFKKKNAWFKEDVNINWEGMFSEIINKLKKYNYIDDEGFARSFVSSRLRNRPRGKSVLISELISKGVEKDIAERVCNEEVEDELEVLKRTFEKKYRGKEFDRKDQKMIAFLLRKGFSWDLIEQLDNNDA